MLVDKDQFKPLTKKDFIDTCGHFSEEKDILYITGVLAEIQGKLEAHASSMNMGLLNRKYFANKLTEVADYIRTAREVIHEEEFSTSLKKNVYSCGFNNLDHTE